MTVLAAWLLVLIAGILVAIWSRKANHPIAKRSLLGIGGALILVGTMMVLSIGLLFHLHGYHADFLAIDACLDRGGSWDYDTRVCTHAPLR
jgi:hypothetical protein